MHDSLNGDLAVRVVVDTKTMSWSPSPSGTVWRKRLHRVGPTESGQVTSLVRYTQGSQFPLHDHPHGEEILVLEGIFSDQQGDWPAGTYLLNPEGFRHAPYSRDGCLLFVKLRQYPGSDRRHVALDTGTIAWEATVPARRLKRLYAQDGYTDSMRLEQWPPGAALGEITYPRGAELLVLRGSFDDEHGSYDARTWLRLPPRSRHHPATSEGCELYVKEGGFTYLRGG